MSDHEGDKHASPLFDALSPAFQPGRTNIRTVLVLAAPGEQERLAGRPAAGATGIVLDELLRRLSVLDPETFPSRSRLDYRIVNAVARIMRKPKPLPTKGQVREGANVRRLERQLSDADALVAFGPSALSAIEAAGLAPTFCGGHPGLQGVNQLPVDRVTTPGENLAARLDLFAALLHASRGRCREAMTELTTIRREVRTSRRDRAMTGGSDSSRTAAIGRD